MGPCGVPGVSAGGGQVAPGQEGVGAGGHVPGVGALGLAAQVGVQPGGEDAGEARVGGDEQGQGGDVERRGQVGEAGVHAHRQPGAGDLGGQLGQARGGKRLGARWGGKGASCLDLHDGWLEIGHPCGVCRGGLRGVQGGGDAPGPLPLPGAAAGQAQVQAGGEQGPAQGDPAVFRPQLVVPAGGGEQHGVGAFGFGADGRGGQARAAGQSVIEGQQVELVGVTEGGGGQPAVAGDGVDAGGDAVGPVVEARRQGFPGRFRGVAGLGAPGLAGDQGALDQPLGVEHGIVGALAQAAAEGADLAPGGALQQVLAPAPHRHRDRLRHARVQTGQSLEAFLDAPVDARLGEVAAQVADHRQVVDHVPQGRGLDQQQGRRGVGAGGGSGQGRQGRMAAE